MSCQCALLEMASAHKDSYAGPAWESRAYCLVSVGPQQPLPYHRFLTCHARWRRGFCGPWVQAAILDWSKEYTGPKFDLVLACDVLYEVVICSYL